MSLSNISKEHIQKLLLSKIEDNNNVISLIKKDNSLYTEFNLLQKQYNFIVGQFKELVLKAEEQSLLYTVDCKVKKTPGNYYYLYENMSTNKLFFSLINPDEWKTKNIFKGKYYYDHDNLFKKI